MVLRLVAGVACGLAGLLHGDDLTLAGGEARMSGTVRSLDEKGVVELVSELSPETIMLKSGAVEGAVFSLPDVEPDPPSGMVELKNGDVISGEIVGFDDKVLSFDSLDMGRLEISREILHLLQLGVERRKVLYSGPRSVEEWSGTGEQSKGWSFDHNFLMADGSATASKLFELPKRFVLKFTLKWEAKMSPSFKICFADPLKGTKESVDRYSLSFSTSGLMIEREVSKAKDSHTVILLSRTPKDYPERELKVEIHVDRNAGCLKVFLNEEPGHEGIDPAGSAPGGSGVALSCNAPGGTVQGIGEIEVSELDDTRSRHHAEERGDTGSDSLISREDDRWGGRLLKIRRKGDGALFRFKSDFQDEPLELAGAEVSTVFFAVDASGDAREKMNPSFQLRLRGGGSLGVASCRFRDDVVSVVHPLLGSLSIRRDGVMAMDRSVQPKPGKHP